jgi:glyoxylase-like metal-dependent hydrolase (beta-lactamase superfamily II)
VDPARESTRRWTIGDTRLTAVVEAESPGVPVEFFFPDATAALVKSVDWLPADAAGSDGTITFRVQSFVLEHLDKLLVVDPCVGNCKQRNLPFWNDLRGPWMERFRHAGFTPEGVDLVVHTHLHEDHFGWDTHLVDGEWVPTFTNARHVYVGDELDWAGSEEQRAPQDAFGDSIAPVLDAGLGWEVGSDSDLGDGLTLISTPGHTPGHVSLVVDTTAEPLIITGDLLHHPFQLAHPLIAEIADHDPALAGRTRSDFLAEHARAGSLLAGTHFPGTPLGRIETHSDGWRFVTEPGAMIQDSAGSPGQAS